MELIIANAIRTDPDLLAKVERASQLLREELGKSAGTVKAEWALVEDPKGRCLLELILSDWTGKVQGLFAPDELEKEPQVRVRLHHLWGDLLQVRSDKQMERLNQLVDQLKGS
jgi:hypothetical protein